MPCRCAGIRKAKCDCDAGFKFTTQTAVLEPSIRNVKKNQFNSTIERLYEKCAAYNLRYCPFSGFVSNENYLSNTIKDFLILCCFILANFVVFITIVTRMSVQIIFLVFESAKWIRRALAKTKPESITPRKIESTNSHHGIESPNNKSFKRKTFAAFTQDLKKNNRLQSGTT